MLWTIRRFIRWCDAGVWERLLEAVVDDPDMEWLIVDATHVKAHRHAAGAAGGRGRRPYKGGGGTKIHLAVDSLGLPLRVSVTAGTVADCSQTLPLISGLRAGHLLADRGYDSDEIVDGAAAMGMVPVIPPRSNRRAKRKYDRYLYRVCHLVENAFLRMKEWRGIATRHAKRLSSFLAFIHLRCAVMWLK